MKTIIRIICLALAASVSSPAFAAGHFRLSGIYWSEETEQSTTTKSSRTLLDLGAGYAWPSGLTVGGLYGTEKRKSGDTSTDRTSYGPTIGYMQSGEGFFVLGTYFFKSEYEDFDGDGYQVDLGYRFKISSVGIGLQMSYKHFKYDEANGSSFSPPLKQTYLDPYFAFWLEF